MNGIESLLIGYQAAALTVLDGELASVRLAFPMNPASWKDSHKSEWADHNIPGRSHPLSHWTGGGPREISFSVELDTRTKTIAPTNVGVLFRGVNRFARTRPSYGPIQPGKGSQSRHDKLILCVNFLKALTKPRPIQRSSFTEVAQYAAPPFVLFEWGRWSRIRCITRSVDVEYLRFTPDLLPVAAKVDVVLHEQPLEMAEWSKTLLDGDPFIPGEAGLV